MQLPNISKIKGNQAVKFDQLINYSVTITFFLNSCRKVRSLVPDPILFFKNALNEPKASGQYISFNIFWQKSTLMYNKNKLFNISDCCFRDMLNFDFSWKELLHHILHVIFQEKYFSCWVLLTVRISLHDCLYFLR